MNLRKLVFGFLLLSALASSAACQTPVNHLIAVLQTSTQELQAAAQLSSAQQAYSVVTRIVNEIFKAMQRMSLPYYQSQLTFLSSQQISLSNRLAALQASVSNNANMLFRMTGAVSSSLAAQTANIGSVVVLYQNTLKPKIDQLENAIQGLSTVVPAATSSLQALQTQLNSRQRRLDPITLSLKQVDDFLTMNQNLRQVYTDTSVDVVESQLGLVATLPFCRSLSVPYPPMAPSPQIPKVAVFAFPVGTNITPLEVVIQEMKADSVDLLLCDRSKTTFNFVPTRLFIELMGVF